MSTGKHYFIEGNRTEGYNVRAADAKRASAHTDTQAQARAKVKQFNPDDHPNVERVEKTAGGKPPQWRATR